MIKIKIWNLPWQDFPADFYVTCATVIPVLFLAVAVQGRAYESVLRAARKAARARSGQPVARRIGWLAASQLFQLVAYGILLAGGLGEFLALAVLYRGRENPGDRPMVFIAALLLVAAVAAGPFLAYGRLRLDLGFLRYRQPDAGTGDDPAETQDE